jgi:hypothetical protein
LTRREQDTTPQDELKKKNREQVLLRPEMLSPELQETIQIQQVICGQLELIDLIRQANQTSPELEEYRQLAKKGHSAWEVKDGLLVRQGKLVVPASFEGRYLRTELIKEAHSTIVTAHPGQTKTRKLLSARYYWKGLIQDVDQYVANCHACRASTTPRDKTPGLLRPLPVPLRPWKDISMDFKDFPTAQNGMDAVVVFIDRLSKRPISIPCYQTCTAKDLATLYCVHVLRYFGPPDTIVSDRGPQFISAFWNELNSLLGTKLLLSTADHPQTDGQTENYNQWLDQRLRPFVNHHQDNWPELVHLVDYAAAVLPHESTGMSPFMVERGYEPRMSFDWDTPSVDYTPRERLSRQEARQLAHRMESVWAQARTNMLKAQERQATQANRHRRAVDWDVGDKVWVTTKNLKSSRPSHKLDYKQQGPYNVLAKKGHSYQLDLPPTMRVHSTFHAEKLRKDPNNPLPGQANPPPEPIQYGEEDEWEVEAVLNSSIRTR